MARAVLRVGQVWRATVPYGDIDNGKTRPVVVLGWRGIGTHRGDEHILVVPSSTFDGDPSKARESDIRLRDWFDAGLSADSFIQCARLWSLAPMAVDFGSPLVGTVSTHDMVAITTEVASFFSVTGYIGIR